MKFPDVVCGLFYISDLIAAASHLWSVPHLPTIVRGVRRVTECPIHPLSQRQGGAHEGGGRMLQCGIFMLYARDGEKKGKYRTRAWAHSNRGKRIRKMTRILFKSTGGKSPRPDPIRSGTFFTHNSTSIVPDPKVRSGQICQIF